ncbi:hypothetical protein [Nocardioides lijunqiniae]|uniref:hypothetical protein n=1 Tax=Nocardioides lijunqiniae TaxID=2760832 RepID=UPI00187863D0|nr:hypothetical protein [Nocardioides lijunqiniae]
MLTLVIIMAAILVLCGLVLTYVAFPHRGAQVPAAPWLGDAMSRAVDAVPTLDEEAADQARRR